MSKDPMLQEILSALRLHGEHVDKRFDEVDKRFNEVEKKFDEITVRLDRIEKKQDGHPVEIAEAHEKVNFISKTVLKHDDKIFENCKSSQ